MESDKYSPDYESFRKLHLIVLNIFKEFKRICEENNLRYYAISGTTLGAALWKGIIPWDDDIDITMPATDFIKFKKLCSKPNFLSKNYSFTEYNWFGGKLHNNKTMCTGIHYINNPKLYTGVFIDIVPLIGLPDDKDEQSKFIDELNSFRESAIIADRFKHIKTGYTKKQLDAWAYNLLNKYSIEKANYVMDFSDTRYVLKASGFKNPIMMPFEDTMIPVSSNYEEDLKIQYQNYSKYPPKEQRFNRNQLLFIIDLEHPYSSYIKSYKKLPSWVTDGFKKWEICAGDYYSYYLQEIRKSKEQMVPSQKYINDLNKVYNSKSYKIGNFLLHPTDHLTKKKRHQ